jgi:hypothetical protein
MRLSKWIKQEGLSYSRAASRCNIININPATNLMRYAKAERIPHPKAMKKIVKGTNNKVQPNDFYEEYWEKNNI